MMDFKGTQQRFFSHIKGQIPSNLTMVDVVAEVLNINSDSAYHTQ
jgi:hypothetical protein